jgi:hypothetical protein
VIFSQYLIRSSLKVLVRIAQQIGDRCPRKLFGVHSQALRPLVQSISLGWRKVDSNLHQMTLPRLFGHVDQNMVGTCRIS